MPDPDCGILGDMTSPPRSVLYVPASRPEFLDKIPSLPADMVLVDLEDGVAPGMKSQARENVRAAIASGVLGSRPWMLRVNGDIPKWPDVNAEFPITVLPREAATLFQEQPPAT